jgi:hypothetical protein
MPRHHDILRRLRQQLEPTGSDFIENARIRLCLTEVQLTLSRVGRALRLGGKPDHWYKLNCYWEIRASALNINVTRRDHLRRLLANDTQHIKHDTLLSPEALAAGHCGDLVKHFAINRHVLRELNSTTEDGDLTNTVYRHYRALYHDITDFDDATFEPMGSMTFGNDFFPDPLQLEELNTTQPIMIRVEISSGQSLEADLFMLLESLLE